MLWERDSFSRGARRFWRPRNSLSPRRIDPEPRVKSGPRLYARPEPWAGGRVNKTEYISMLFAEDLKISISHRNMQEARTSNPALHKLPIGEDPGMLDR